MTSVSALPPALPRSRQRSASPGDGGDAFATMLAGIAGITAAPTSGSAPKGTAATGVPADVPSVGGPTTGVPATGPLGAGGLPGGAVGPGVVQPGVIEVGVVQPGVPQPGVSEPGAVQPGVIEPSVIEAGVVQAEAAEVGPALPPGAPVIEDAATAPPAAPTTTEVPVPGADTAAASTTAQAADPDTQDAGNQAGAQPEAPPFEAVDTAQPQVVDVRPLGTDQAVGALGEQRRTDTVAPVTAPAPAAPPPPAAQVVQLLAPLLEGPDGAHSISLQLHPEELGAVQVDVALLRGEITLALHARDLGAQDALRAALPMLRAELEASGLVATSVSVDGGRTDQQPGERPAHHGGSLPGGTGDGAPAGPPVLTTSNPDAALDVRM